MKRNVLFVDDEPNVLSALRRMLRPLQDEWTVVVAEGGAQALTLLKQKPFDLVISDMRMPGMTGVQLLEEVGRHHPRTVRIILTGQCDEESGLRALRVAHQMLYKPCEAATLKATVSRIDSLKQLLADETLLAMVTRQTTIPSLPNRYRRLVDELNSASPSLDQVAVIIGTDIGMAAKILHLVSSSFVGLPRDTTNPKTAVALLGLDTMQSLVAANAFSCSNAADGACPMLGDLQTHSNETGALAGNIMRTEAADPRDVEYAIMAGLLHDVGKRILLEQWPQIYSNVLEQSLISGRPSWEIETEVFGASHAQIGACLLGLWGLPVPIVDAIAWHHQPGQCPDRLFGVLTAVHAANVLSRDGAPKALDLAYLQRLNLLHRVPVWSELSRAHRAERKLACM